jgi:hypothetical protein
MIHENSRIAYEEHKLSKKGSAWRNKIYQYLCLQVEGKSDREIFFALEAPYYSDIQPEITRLISAGLLMENGKKRCQYSNKMVRITKIAIPRIQGELF